MPCESADKFLHLKVPTSLHEAVSLAAEREMSSISVYVRRCLIDRVRADGIDPARLDVHQ